MSSANRKDVSVLYVNNSLCLLGGRIGRAGYFLNRCLILFLVVGGSLLIEVIFPLVRNYMPTESLNITLKCMAYCPLVTGGVILQFGNTFKRLRDIYRIENPSWVWSLCLIIPVVSLFFALFLLFAPGAALESREEFKKDYAYE
jgi:uncharacterized membrane protein YhaH (DUF805 family)